MSTVHHHINDRVTVIGKGEGVIADKANAAQAATTYLIVKTTRGETIACGEDQLQNLAAGAREALDEWKVATSKLSRTLEHAGISEIDDYPECLPSFDEFAAEVIAISIP